MTIFFTCSGRYRFCLGLLCWLASHMGVLGLPSTTYSNKISETAKSSKRDEPARVSTNPPFVSLSGTSSVSAIDPAKCYRLVSRLSGKVIGIDANGQADGTPLRQRTDANLLAQGWRFTPEGNYYNITVLHTQKGLQVANSSVADDALVEQWTYWGGYHQQWLVERNGEGFYSIRNRNSTKALTVRDASVAEGALISQQPLGTGQHQQWRIEERSCTTTPLPTTNRAPIAVATATSLTGTSPLSVTFTGSASADPDGDPITYEWDFGDGSSFSAEANPVKVFTAKPASQGIGLVLNYTVRLTVIDNKGQRSAVQTLYVSLANNAPTVRITNPVNGTSYALDNVTSYSLAASVTGNSLRSQIWEVKLRKNNREQLVTTASGANPVINISPVGCEGEDAYYLITVKVTDFNGLTGQDSVRINPDCNSPRLSVTNLTATPFTNVSTVRLNWTNPAISFDDVLVVGKAGAGIGEIPLEPAYTANTSFTGNGSDFYGGKVLYQGTGTSVTVTDLAVGQTYYFRVYTRKGRGWTGGVAVNATPASGNRPPVAVATATSLTGTSPLSVTFTGSASSDPDGDPITYEWDFGDGSPFSTEANPVKTFTIRPGAQGVPQLSYSVRLVVRDNRGGVATSQLLLVSLRNSVSAIDPAKCYRLVSRLSGKVIGIDANGQADGTPLRQRTDANLLAQGWRFTPEGNYYNITVLHTQKGLQVANSSVADDALVEQWTYWGGYHQQWLVERNGEGFYSIRNRNSTKALTVRDASVPEGALISQQPLGAGQHQQWRIEERSCPAAGRVGAEKTDVAFSLWPNPARDHVLINLSAAGNQSVDMQLTDLLGRSLQQQQLEVVPAEPYRVDTSHLPNGLYLIRLTPAGQLPATLRLLIQR